MITRIRSHGDLEHRLQVDCVNWFRLQYPKIAHAIFAIPNGGSRNKVEAARMKLEGVTAGVSDLILLKSNSKYGALCIEMKTPSGTQSPTQKHWQKVAEETGNKYVLCRSIQEFIQEVNDYLSH